MTAGKPRDHDAPDGTDGEEEGAFDASDALGEAATSRSEQNGDTR